jgi:subtilisin family serine protease
VRIGDAGRGAAAIALAALVTGTAAGRGPSVHYAVAAYQPGGDALHLVAKRPLTHRRLSSATGVIRTRTTPPATVIPSDPDWSQQWALTLVNAPAAWKVSTGSKPVVVAVVDSGVDASQPDLQGALVPGADFADDSGDTTDRFGHGTMVAGVIAARPNNGIGGAGICWTCRVMPIKVLGSDGSGSAPAIAAGIRWAADHGANVISMSFVLSGPDVDIESALAYAHSRGVLLIAAAGNAGGDSPTYPASDPDVVSVAAVDQSGALYPWSTHGTWVTLAAPGCSLSTAMGGSFAMFCGTSAAAPLVAGLAGLALSSGNVSAADVEAALEQTAVPLPGSVGSGRVDALALLQREAAH